MNNSVKLLEVQEDVDRGLDTKIADYLRDYVKVLEDLEAIKLKVTGLATGDRVMLNITPRLTNEHGWWGSRGFLKTGATGVVTDVDWNSYSNEFTVGVQFDKQTWIDQYGQERPHDLVSYATYYIDHYQLTKLPPIKPWCQSGIDQMSPSTTDEEYL